MELLAKCNTPVEKDKLRDERRRGQKALDVNGRKDSSPR